MLDTLLVARRDHAFGPQRDYFDHENVIGGPDSGIRIILAHWPFCSATARAQKTMFVDRRNARFRDLTGSIAEVVTTDASGNGVFRCSGGSVSVWVEEGSSEPVRDVRLRTETMDAASSHRPDRPKMPIQGVRYMPTFTPVVHRYEATFGGFYVNAFLVETASSVVAIGWRPSRTSDVQNLRNLITNADQEAAESGSSHARPPATTTRALESSFVGSVTFHRRDRRDPQTV